MTDWNERRSGKPKHQDDARTDFEVDYSRIIHSGFFRSLQGKTQILSLGYHDFYRTRLTHSLEVAQVASGIVQNLSVNEQARLTSQILPSAALISTIGLAHDLGHPPYGHGGEIALNYCMRKHGGFEGNAQTLRILTALESYSENSGADLTRRSLLGILKYPSTFGHVTNPSIAPRSIDGPTSFVALDLNACKPPKAIFDTEADILAWILAPLSDADRTQFSATKTNIDGHNRTIYKSLDCSIMDVADEIAYGVHDLEDAIALGFIKEHDFRSGLTEEDIAPFVSTFKLRPLSDGDGVSYDHFVDALFGSARARKNAIGRLVNFFIRSVFINLQDKFSEPLLDWRASMNDECKLILNSLQKLIAEKVINSPQVQHLEFKGQRMVVAVFEALMTDPKRLLPVEVWDTFAKSERSPRIICDYVASFTDTALLRTYDRLFSPRSGSVFDRI